MKMWNIENVTQGPGPEMWFPTPGSQPHCNPIVTPLHQWKQMTKVRHSCCSCMHLQFWRFSWDVNLTILLCSIFIKLCLSYGHRWQIISLNIAQAVFPPVRHSVAECSTCVIRGIYCVIPNVTRQTCLTWQKPGRNIGIILACRDCGR